MTSRCSGVPLQQGFSQTLEQTLQHSRQPQRLKRGVSVGRLPPTLSSGKAPRVSRSASPRPGFLACRAYSSDAAPSPRDPPSAADPQVSPDQEGTAEASSSPAKPWWKVDSNELREKVAKLGLAAVLAYGLFDGVTYTIFFVLAFLGYEKSTGLNPAANLKALLGIVILMWTGNNVTRPFRVAGAAALAPALDNALRRLQKALRLPNQFLAFALVVVSFVSICFSIVGLLILSRWGR